MTPRLPWWFTTFIRTLRDSRLARSFAGVYLALLLALSLLQPSPTIIVSPQGDPDLPYVSTDYTTAGGYRKVTVHFDGDGGESSVRRSGEGDFLLHRPHSNTLYYVRAVSEFGPLKGDGWYRRGEVAVISAPTIVYSGAAIRRIFVGWSESSRETPFLMVTVDRPLSFTPRYKRQYLLIVEYGGPELVYRGWYDEGARVRVEAISPIGFGVQRRLQGWGGDIQDPSPSILLTLDSAKRISASWTTDYTQMAYLGVGLLMTLIAVEFGPTAVRRRGFTYRHAGEHTKSPLKSVKDRLHRILRALSSNRPRGGRAETEV